MANLFKLSATVLVALSAHAAADVPTSGTTSALSPTQAVQASAVVEGDGVKVGEATVLHPTVGLETGFVSNMFYQDSAPVSAALLRVLMQVGVGSLSRARLETAEGSGGQGEDEATDNQGRLVYRANLNLNYDQYLTSNDSVADQSGLGVGMLLQATVNPLGQWSFSGQDQFQRLLRAANFESTADTNRDINRLRLSLDFKPRGRALSGFLYYINTIDVFEESSQQFANRFLNVAGVRLNWQWLPKTRFYADFSQSAVTGLGADAVKVTAFPLVALVGTQTLLTPKTGISARLGYTNGFYSSGPSYSAVVASLQFGYRYSPLGGVGVSYAYQHDDSINANYYRDHAVTLGVSQQFVPFLAVASLDVRLRHYDGITVVTSPTSTRDDFLATFTLGARYNYRNWLGLTADYSLTTIQTDYTYMTPDGYMDDPSFVRHQLLAGARAAF